MITTFDVFYKKYIVHRASMIDELHMIDTIKLPGNIVLHLMDNMSSTHPNLLTPDNNNPILFHTEGIKYITHITEPSVNKKDLISTTTKGTILTKSTLNKELKDFQLQHKKEYRYVATIDDIPERKDVTGIVSHNPMFRVRISGRYNTIKKFNYVFSNLINIINQHPKRIHFVHVPLDPITFDKGDFTRTFNGYNTSSIRYPESLQFLFMMHLLGWLEGVEDSYFTQIPNYLLDRITFVITCDGKSIYYNLKDLKKLHKKSSILSKVINTINSLTTEEVSKIDEVARELVSIPKEATTNSPRFNKALPKETLVENNQQFVEDIDQASVEHIKNMDNLTPSQRRRLNNIANKYKTIEVDGKTIEEILLDPVDEDLDKNTLDFLEDDLVDKSMATSSITNFDNQYMEKSFKKDLVTNLLAFNKQGMFLTGFKEEVKKSELNHMRHYTVNFEDVNGKSHTIKFTLPDVDKDGNCLLNGSLKTMKKQRINLPICKVNSKRVTLSSNYTKSMVERNTNVAHNFFSALAKLVSKYPQKITVSYGSSETVEGVVLPYQYSTIGARYTSLEINRSKFSFDYKNRLNALNSSVKTKVLELEKEYGTYLGKKHDTNQLYFMDTTCTLYLIHYTSGEATRSGFLSELSKLLDEPINPISEWVEIKIQNKKIPVIFMLAYRYGLKHMLEYLDVNHSIHEPRSRIPKDPDKIKIVFKDKTLLIDRVPIVTSLIFSGLNFFDLSNYYMEQMDEFETYHELATDKGLHFNFVRGMDNFINLFIDPITRDILLQMQEPTNVKDLLIRATTLISTEDHQPASSAANFRFRSYEKMAGMVYNELSRSLVVYQGNNIGANNKFSVNPYVIKQRVIKDQLFSNVDIVNPIHDIKKTSGFSHMGEGGRSADTFMIPDRQFTKDSIGTISEANIDSGTVAINAYTSMDPTIVNTRGLCEIKDVKDIEPTELLSVTALAVPGATNDDGKRASFINGQMSQYVPTAKSDVCRLRTGYEKVMAHRTTEPFASAAEQDGVVESIDEQLKLIKVKYKDGTKTTFSYGEQYTNNGGGGFYVTQNIVNNGYKPGSKVKRGDVVCYNQEYFEADPYTKQVNWKMGYCTNVVFIEGDATIEDSDCMTQKLSDALSFSPTHVREVVITHDTNIHKILEVGSEVTNIDPLLTFDNSAVPDTLSSGVDDETVELLNKLNFKTPKAKHNGTLVKIEALYNSPISEMSKSLAKVVRAAIKDKNSRSEFSKDTKNADKHPKSQEITDTDRMGLIDFSPGTVILKFYIKQNIDVGNGDKVVCGTSLKTVTSKVIPESIQVEDGSIEADMMMSWIGVNNRIVSSVVLIGVSNRILAKMEEDILDMYFDK